MLKTIFAGRIELGEFLIVAETMTCGQLPYIQYNISLQSSRGYKL